MKRVRFLLFVVVVWSCCMVGLGSNTGWLPSAPARTTDRLRRVLFGEKPQQTLSTKTCKNTVQGRTYITDDQGVLCQRQDVDYKTGCCSQGTKHTCDRCNLRDKCCSEYEFCVSCCLAPEHNAQSLAKTVLRAPGRQETGYWGDGWDYCAGMCRTHGRSLSHENAYIDGRHHCFSKLGKPLLSTPLPSGALNNVEVVVGAAGESCEAVCARTGGGKACSAVHFKLLNTCDQLRELLGCEAGCVAEKGKIYYPAYVESSAPKPQRPALCLVSNDSPEVTCSSREQFYRRLCPCTERI